MKTPEVKVDCAKVNALCKVDAENFDESRPLPLTRLMIQATAHFRPLDRYPRLVRLVKGEAEATSLTDRVYDEFLIRIIRGDLPGGTELKSTQWAQVLSVSRTPVNQALSRLLADGIVSQQTHHRAIVRKGAENWLIDIHALRQHLEPPAAHSAAGKIPKQIADELLDFAEEVRTASPEEAPGAMRYFDFSLHLLVAEYCHNLPLRETIRKCWMYKRLSYEAAGDPGGVRNREFEEHVQILRALISGDGIDASRRMAEHLQHATLTRSHQRVI